MTSASISRLWDWYWLIFVPIYCVRVCKVKMRRKWKLFIESSRSIDVEYVTCYLSALTIYSVCPISYSSRRSFVSFRLFAYAAPSIPPVASTICFLIVIFWRRPPHRHCCSTNESPNAIAHFPPTISNWVFVTHNSYQTIDYLVGWKEKNSMSQSTYFQLKHHNNKTHAKHIRIAKLIWLTKTLGPWNIEIITI